MNPAVLLPSSHLLPAIVIKFLMFLFGIAIRGLNSTTNSRERGGMTDCEVAARLDDELISLSSATRSMIVGH